MSFLSALFGGGASQRVNGARARELVASGAQLLDVRTAMEFGEGHLTGAVNIPVHELPQRVAELDTTKPVVVYCRSGARSASATSILSRSGFTQVHDLGPMGAW